MKTLKYIAVFLFGALCMYVYLWYDVLKSFDEAVKKVFVR